MSLKIKDFSNLRFVIIIFRIGILEVLRWCHRLPFLRLGHWDTSLLLLLLFRFYGGIRSWKCQKKKKNQIVINEIA